MSAERRCRVITASGSVYILDWADLTWTRDNTNKGHEQIFGLEGVTWGHLSTWPAVIEIGQSMRLDDLDGAWIRTTPVVSIEDEA